MAGRATMRRSAAALLTTGTFLLLGGRSNDAAAQESSHSQGAAGPPSAAARLQTDGSLTITQAVAEAIEHNLGLLAERLNLTVAEARLVTAQLHPNRAAG